MTENQPSVLNEYFDRNWKLLLLILGLFTAAVAFYGSGLEFFYDIDEPKYARSVYEMIHTGNFLAPMFDGVPRMEKPPLTYWIMSPFMWIAAKISAQTAGFYILRLPTVICSVLISLGTASIGRRLFGSTTGIMAGVLMVSSLLFKFMSVMMKVDIVFTCCVTWSVYFYLEYYLGRTTKTVTFGAAVLTALGVLAKGPFAFLPLAGFVAACVIRKNVQNINSSGKNASFTGAISLSGIAPAAKEYFKPVLLWFLSGCIPFFVWLYAVLVLTGFDYTQGLVGQFFLNTATTTTKVFAKFGRLDPYFDTLTVIFFPWGGYLFGAVFGVWKVLREKYNEKYVFVICVTLTYLLVFTLLFKLKSNRYMLPVLPFVSILISDWLINSKRDKAYKTMFEMGFVWICSMAGMMLYRSFKFKMVTVNLADGIMLERYIEYMTPFFIAAGVFFIILLLASIVQYKKPVWHILAGSVAIVAVMPFYYHALPSYASMDINRPLPILGQYVSDDLVKNDSGKTLVMHRPFFISTFPDVVYYLKKLDKDGTCMYSLGTSANPVEVIQTLATPENAVNLFEKEHKNAAKYPAYSYFKNSRFNSAVLLLSAYDYTKFKTFLDQLPAPVKPYLNIEKKVLLSVKWVPEEIYIVRFKLN